MKNVDRQKNNTKEVSEGEFSSSSSRLWYQRSHSTVLTGTEPHLIQGLVKEREEGGEGQQGHKGLVKLIRDDSNTHIHTRRYNRTANYDISHPHLWDHDADDSRASQ